jgi:hemoglobin
LNPAVGGSTSVEEDAIMATTPFERYGGFANVRKIVSEFYDRILSSETLQPYFEGTDMRLLIDHQTKFISSMMGGPGAFSDDALRRAHTRLNVSRKDFVEMTEVLRETLEDFDLDEDDINAVCSEVVRREPLIVVNSDV